MALITFLYSRIIKLIVDSDNIFKGGNSMASSSIFIYELRSPAEINVESIYSRLKGYPEDKNTYFNLEMISANELLGEYVIVQNAQESCYNPEQRVFEYRIVPKANVISFSITDGFLEIWGNKTSANKLVFELSNLLAPISINSVEVTIDTLLEKLKGYKLKVSKVCFQDFLFTEDIVGNFTVDLSSYGDAFSILQKYNDKISSMTIILYCDNSSIKLRITAKGRVTVYKSRSSMDDEEILFLHQILLNGGEH